MRKRRRYLWLIPVAALAWTGYAAFRLHGRAALLEKLVRSGSLIELAAEPADVKWMLEWVPESFAITVRFASLRPRHLRLGGDLSGSALSTFVSEPWPDLERLTIIGPAGAKCLPRRAPRLRSLIVSDADQAPRAKVPDSAEPSDIESPNCAVDWRGAASLFPELQRLSLEGDGACASVRMELAQLRSLEELDIDWKAPAPLVELQKLPCLRSLTLDGHGLEASDWEQLRGFAALRELSLGDDEHKPGPPAIGLPPGLESLELCNITAPEASEWLIAGIAKAPALRKLTVMYSVDCFELERIATNPALEDLTLYRCDGGGVADHHLEIIAKAPRLRALTLANNELGDRAGSILRGMERLERFEAESSIDREGLLAGLAGHPNLIELKLKLKSFNADEIRTLETIPRLQRLSIDSLYGDDSAIARMKDFLTKRGGEATFTGREKDIDVL